MGQATLTFFSQKEKVKQKDIYLIKEVNDAAVGFPILWNQMPLNQVVNHILEKSWDWLNIACLQHVFGILHH